MSANKPHQNSTLTPRKSISNNSLNRLASSGMLVSADELTVEASPFAHGEFGTVHRALWRKSQICVKALKTSFGGKSNPDAELEGLEDMLNEICVWSTVRHPAIVTFLGCTLEDPKRPLVLMEYMAGDTLEHSLKKYGAMSTTSVVEQALQVARGMAMLHGHSPRIIHRDLKPSNLLYSSSHRTELKIADFGLSKMLIEKRDSNQDLQALASYHMTGGTGSCRYMAPENYWYEAYDHKVDVYSFGMILYYMITGEAPFLGCRRADLDGIHRNQTRPRIPSNHPLCQVITSCWAHSASDRPAFDQVIDMLNEVYGGSQGEAKEGDIMSPNPINSTTTNASQGRPKMKKSTSSRSSRKGFSFFGSRSRGRNETKE